MLGTVFIRLISFGLGIVGMRGFGFGGFDSAQPAKPKPAPV
jgi:hypothetical protein